MDPDQHQVGGYRQDTRHWDSNGEVKVGGSRLQESLFSATPPIESMRFVLSCEATTRKDGKVRKTMCLDIKKAHLVPLCKIGVHVELPPEAEVQEDECGKLIQRFKNYRPSAQAWEQHYSTLLKTNKFKQLKSVPVAFVHTERDMIGVVHGTTSSGRAVTMDLDWVLKVLEKEYELKNRGRLRPDPNDERKIAMLGRITEYTDEGITRSGDPKTPEVARGLFRDGQLHESTDQQRVRRRWPERAR